MGIAALGFTPDELTNYFKRTYGKGSYHAAALFRHIYSTGNADIRNVPEYRQSLELAKAVSADFSLVLPKVAKTLSADRTRKFSLLLTDSHTCECVLLPMNGWSTLCISSQIGCARACAFCATGRMGLVRNLATEEIVAQWAAARFVMHEKPRNIVFMGMGEPFDNFDKVVHAIRILSNPNGPNIPKRRISISTAGHVEGIRALTELEKRHGEEAWRTLRLCISINAPGDELRNRLMPINRIWPLQTLKQTLMDSPQAADDDTLHFEYVLIPGINDSPEQAGKLLEWLDGLGGKINLIPHHPTNSDSWGTPNQETINRFHSIIRASGRECRTRRSRGEDIAAACGMLGGEVYEKEL